MSQPRSTRQSAIVLVIALVSSMVSALLAVTSAAPAQAAGATHSYLVNASSPARTAAAQTAAQAAGGTVVQAWPQIGVLVVRSTRPDFAARLRARRSPAVASVADARQQAATEAVAARTVTTAAVPARRGTSQPVTGSDPMQPKQGYLGTDRAVAAHRVTGGSPAVVVGVIDTGVDDRHPDLKPNFSAADSVDCTAGGRPNTKAGAWRGSDSHGTHVAGTIAAARNGLGVTGIAPRVKVASIKVVDANGSSYPEYLVCAYLWAGLHGLAVTNASINLFDYWCGELGIEGPALTAVQRAVAWSAARGVAHVQSAGNAGEDTSWQLRGTCRDPLAGRADVVQVGSVTTRGTLSGFSSRGRGVVDIAAPGEAIWSDSTRGRYEARTGTSQAAPQVAATLALMKSKRPRATGSQLVSRLRGSARGVPLKTVGRGCTGTPKSNSCTGWGQLDVLAAVHAA